MSDADDAAVVPDGGGVIATLRLLAGGAAGATALTLLNVPAGAIVGAVLGSALVNGLRPGGSLSRPLRVAGLLLLGCAAGVQLEAASLETLLRIAVPLGVAVLALLALDVLLAVWLSRRYGIDPVTALFACAPGGVSEIAVAADEAGARTGVVISIHVMRVLLVVLVALPILVVVLGQGP
jgi:membrane AbrB-like protein